MTDQTAPSVMTLGYADGRKETINMKDKKDSDVLRQLLELTKATTITATVDEEAELKRIAEQEIKSEEQRVQARIDKEEREREERLLAQARGQIVDGAQ
jgi:large subunit ribosomal protein MRP49